MRATPKKRGKTAALGSRFLSDVVADNVRALRALRRLSQTELAKRMGQLGHKWTRATVSDVERAGRNVTVDELLGLALALTVSVPELLDPTKDSGLGLDYADGYDPLEPTNAWRWITGKTRVEVGWGTSFEGIGVEPAEDQRPAGKVWQEFQDRQDAYRAARQAPPARRMKGRRSTE
jgi:transcriptional regulator with XRE-family HTH domain